MFKITHEQLIIHGSYNYFSGRCLNASIHYQYIAGMYSSIKHRIAVHLKKESSRLIHYQLLVQVYTSFCIIVCRRAKTAHLKAATAHGLAAEKLREGYKQNGIGKEDFEGGISHAEAHDGYQKMHANFAK